MPVVHWLSDACHTLRRWPTMFSASKPGVNISHMAPKKISVSSEGRKFGPFCLQRPAQKEMLAHTLGGLVDALMIVDALMNVTALMMGDALMNVSAL